MNLFKIPSNDDLKIDLAFTDLSLTFTDELIWLSLTFSDFHAFAAAALRELRLCESKSVVAPLSVLSGRLIRSILRLSNIWNFIDVFREFKRKKLRLRRPGFP